VFARVRAILSNLGPTPDWTGKRALILLTLAVGGLACVIEASTNSGLPGFRDTDDAMRLEMVRGLLGGRGWFDQLITRVYPPHGLWPHWSRLLDGGLAAMMSFLRLFLSPADAEYWTRFFWPLLWIFPGVAGALVLARNLGGRSAVVIAALLLLCDTALYRQFYPGRIDHHDVQIVMTVIALACATARSERTRWAWVAGGATSFGLAVGLEALPMQALVGASYGFALMRDRNEAPAAGAYGCALAGGSLALFLVQTPPARWSLSFCDALALNLVAALIVAGLGLALAAALSRRMPTGARAALIAGVGGLAAAAYLGLDPQCVHGPFAGVDPGVKAFWLDHIQEVQPIPKMLLRNRGVAIAAIIVSVLALASAIWLTARQWRAPASSTLLALLSVCLAAAVGWSAWRMQDYVCWVGLPVLAAAYSLLARRWLGELIVPTILAALLLSPPAIGWAIIPLVNAATVPTAKPAPRPKPIPNLKPRVGAGAKPAPTNRKPVAAISRPIDRSPRCFAAAAYAPLAALPPGEVLSIQDFGPFILVFTHDTTVAAPYHRLWPAILQVHRALASPPPVAETYVRRLGADYIIDCPPYPTPADRGSLGGELRAGRIPSWLKRLSAPDATLKIYRVLPPTETK
jgi:hypothetical protein